MGTRQLTRHQTEHVKTFIRMVGCCLCLCLVLNSRRRSPLDSCLPLVSPSGLTCHTLSVLMQAAVCVQVLVALYYLQLQSCIIYFPSKIRPEAPRRWGLGFISLTSPHLLASNLQCGQDCAPLKVGKSLAKSFELPKWQPLLPLSSSSISPCPLQRDC